MILETAIETILATGKISLRELRLLQQVLLDNISLDRQQNESIRIVHDRLNMGLIQVAC